MIAASKRATPAPRCAGGRYARFDEEYLLEVRPHLTDGEARVYELLVLRCDGWDRPVAPGDIAELAGMHVDTARRFMRRLEHLGLIRSHWHGPPKSAASGRTIEIVRDYTHTREALRRTNGRHTEKPAYRIVRSHGMGSQDPMSWDPAIPSHLIARSDPDLPSLPSREPGTSPRVSASTAMERGTGTKNTDTREERPGDRPSTEPARDELTPTPAASAVPQDLVALARQLWGPDVAFKAAHRYLGRLLAIGKPPASVEEIARYLKWAAKSSRVQRARFPISVACMPEECADWLRRYRQLRVVPSTAPPPQPNPIAVLTLSELGRRAEELCAQLASIQPPTVRPNPVNEGAAPLPCRGPVS